MRVRLLVRVSVIVRSDIDIIADDDDDDGQDSNDTIDFGERDERVIPHLPISGEEEIDQLGESGDDITHRQQSFRTPFHGFDETKTCNHEKDRAADTKRDSKLFGVEEERA